MDADLAPTDADPAPTDADPEPEPEPEPEPVDGDPEPVEAVPEAGAESDGPDQPPPPVDTKLPGRDPIWARLLVVFGSIVVLLASGVVVTSRVLAHRYETSVTKASLLAPAARVSAPAQERRSTIVGPLNFLLIGSDQRPDDDPAERSDTVIVVHVPASLDRAYLLSIPRDLRVAIPPFPETGFRGWTEKINGAFQHGGGGAGGVRLLSETLTNLLGIRFDGAAIIDFGGFQKVVQLLGGVHMCIDVRTESHHIGHDKNGDFLAPWYGPEGQYRNRDSTPVVYEPGCQHLAAWQALDFVRQRKSLPDGDYGRQRHQQQFLRALFERAQAKDLTSNPLELDRFIRAVGESLTVDLNGIPLDELMFGLRNVKPSNLLGLQLPSAPEDHGGVSYIIASQEAEQLYTALREDTLEAWAAANPNWVNRI